MIVNEAIAVISVAGLMEYRELRECTKFTNLHHLWWVARLFIRLV